MLTLEEGELYFTFEGVVSAREFDGPDHGLSHCMKAVDFIVEFTHKYLFIEVKDPQDSGATSKDRNKWIQKFASGSLEDLKHKYRDSFLYEWAAGRGDKPIVYVVLIALDSLDPALLSARQDKLHQILPKSGPGSRPWVRPIVQECIVLNIATWNRMLPGCTVTRKVPAGAGDATSQDAAGVDAAAGETLNR